MRKYLSQNLRRVSEPIEIGRSSKKLSSYDFAKVPIPAEQQETEDELSYEQNVDSLLARTAPNHNRIYQLLKLTHKTRRESSMVHSSTIKEQYPYLGSKKWVRLCACIQFTCIILHFIHAGCGRMWQNFV